MCKCTTHAGGLRDIMILPPPCGVHQHAGAFSLAGGCRPPLAAPAGWLGVALISHCLLNHPLNHPLNHLLVCLLDLTSLSSNRLYIPMVWKLCASCVSCTNYVLCTNSAAPYIVCTLMQASKASAGGLNHVFGLQNFRKHVRECSLPDGATGVAVSTSPVNLPSISESTCVQQA